MKLKVPRRLTAFFLSMLLGAGLCGGCKKEEAGDDFSKNKTDDTKIEVVYETVEDTVELEESITEEEKEEVSESILDNFEKFEIAKATSNVKLREESGRKSKQVGLLLQGEYLIVKNKVDDDWYEVEYNGKSAYVSSEYVDIIECYELPYNHDVPFIEDNIEDYVLEEKSIIATANVNIRKGPDTSYEKISLLNKNETLPLIRVLDNGWYEVEYNGETAYVICKYAKEIKGYSLKCEMSDMIYMTDKTPLIDIETSENIQNIPKNEVAEVYAQNEDYYLVKADGKVGYISKNYCQSLGDTYVIIDISDQNIKVYQEDKLIVDSPIVTGKDSSPTYCGIFDVYKKEEHVHWPEFKVTVKYWMPFNRGEGMHDADWRKEFGGTIYHKKGSHGCVNLPVDVAPIVYDTVEVGTPVLVKK